MRPPGHLLPPASALGLIPQKLPRVTPVHDCTLQGEQPQHRDRACTGPEGTAGQSSFMVWGHRAHRMPREGTGIMAQPVRFCSLRGRGRAPSHPDKTVAGAQGSPAQPAHREQFGQCFASTRISPTRRGACENSHPSGSPPSPAQAGTELLARRASTVLANKPRPGGTAAEVVFGSVLALAPG